MGAETSVVVALFFLGFLVVTVVSYSSIDYAKNLVKNAQYDQDTMKKAKMQTDIAIINVTNKTTYLNLTLKNTGKTTLNASALDVFYDGKYYTYNLLSARNTWTSETDLNISVNLVPQTNNRIKVVSENGISDYALVP